MSANSQFPHEQAEDGSFARQEDAFRDWVKAEPAARFPAEAGRYHLYISWACPWAHRVAIVRKLKGLEKVIGMTAVDPIRTEEEGWAFREGPGHSADPINGFSFLKEAYLATQSSFEGRITVPVLWDKHAARIVSNSDDDLMRILDREFDAFTETRLNLVPADIESSIDALNQRIYDTVNNGVYLAGFATRQEAYESAVIALFQTLDELEERLAKSRYLFGSQITETDWRLFVTLVRFDPVYHGHFKCNLRKLSEYPHLSGYLRDLYQRPGVAETVNFDHIKRHYYVTHDDINPSGIVPLGPIEDLMTPHGREALGQG